MTLTGRTILVTGGTSGIGEAIATRLAADGAAVVIGARRPDAGAAVVTKIRAAGGTALFVPADVTVQADAARLVTSAVDAFGRLDGAVNNAGTVTATGPLTEVTADAWRAELDANLTSVFYGLKHQIPALLATGGGAIVVNASVGAVRGIPGLAAYVAAKHGTIGLTRSAALECADRGVRVNAIVTGNVDTPLYRGLVGLGAEDPMPPAPNPTGRVASPAEVAELVAFLLGDESRFITGAAIPIDGGATA